MSYLYETHFHTMEVSPCGRTPAAEGVQMYKNAGYSGIMVTDHISSGYMANDYKGDTWKEKIDYYLRGYREAKKHETSDFAVLLGMELRFDNENGNDYLIFGIDEDFLYNNEDFLSIGIKEFKAYSDTHELTVIQAHPFRKNMFINEPRYIDGMEVFNGNRRHESSNAIAKAWAEKFGLMTSSGSDFHEREDFARGGIYLENFVRDSKEFRKEFLKGTAKLKEL